MTLVRKSFLRGKSIKGHQPNWENMKSSVYKRPERPKNWLGQSDTQVLKSRRVVGTSPAKQPLLVSDLTLLGQLSDRVTPSTFPRKTTQQTALATWGPPLVSQARGCQVPAWQLFPQLHRREGGRGWANPGHPIHGAARGPVPRPTALHPLTRGVTPTRT